ncbi:MAG: hypothetical protein LBJ88_05935 [Campylobacteraceae bacterium]|jgi:ppGpp synthetase/RelA/SpoT-type nucleotidyltranferase|nr:hypothetical protein [Campylobacteraceae bacterium]
MDIKDIVEKWSIDKFIYDKMGKIIINIIRQELSNTEIFPEISLRIKDLLSIVKKIKRHKENYSYGDLKDKLGIRIICTFESELDIIDSTIKNFFNVERLEYKKTDYNILDYKSNHYDVYINSELKEFKEIRQYNSYVFEIQVRTFNQHAWSNASHKLLYKNEKDLPDELKRKLYRLLVLYELADQEIENINSYRRGENIEFTSLLAKIEGKFYKYAKVDYDKEITTDNMAFLSTIFTKENKENINNGIESFIDMNRNKIEAIFNDNRFRFHEIPLLTQPEIFIMWYALENFENILIDRWNNYFDFYDSEQVQTFWGIVG